MKLAYVTTYDARSLKGSNEWSGTGYYIAQSLINQSFHVKHLGPLKEPVSTQVIYKLKRRYCELFHKKNYQKDADPLTLKSYASQIAKKLKSMRSDIVFSATASPIAYLECEQPIVFWTDATFANLRDFYPLYSNLHEDVVKDWQRMEELALQKCKLAIYSSDWAANSAIRDYQADPSKVKVVPFGANLDSSLNFNDIKEFIHARPSERCKLLFLGTDWHRKGGDIAFKVTKKLNRLGLKTELTVVGCNPIVEESLPDYVKCLGFISKSTVEGKEKICQLIAESHFLILPSKAECYGIVFCEANSLGTPCLSTNVGGIPTIIKNNINGQLFPVDAFVDRYCDYITNLFANYSDYKKLAFSTFDEYKERLNWKVAGQTIKELLMTIV
jgi:glycosyltransferase involved in cell wall biosynthesis